MWQLLVAVYFARTFVTIFWICDILNMPFMAKFDTTYPLNGLFWFLVFLFCGTGYKTKGENEDDGE